MFSRLGCAILFEESGYVFLQQINYTSAFGVVDFGVLFKGSAQSISTQALSYRLLGDV